ncbi:MAG: hypothetical protein H7210_00830 [Pyrinomonadaceae bacterium]|nr:hypothetical protein [Phycisphaerales bacterium]
MNKSLISVSLLLSCCAVAQGSIVSTTGMATQIAPPPVANFPAINNPFAQCWDEQQGRMLSAPLLADMTTNPSNNGSAVAGPVAFGTYNSHFIHWSTLPPALAAAGTVTFDGQIRYVFYGDNTLDMSDLVYGAFGTVYPTTQPGRGISAATILSISGNTLTFNFASTAGNIDIEQVRVLTDLVPSPGAMSLAALGSLVALRRRRA